MRWGWLLVLAAGCDWVLGLPEPEATQASRDAAEDTNRPDAMPIPVDVTPGGGPTKRYDLAAGPIVLDFQTSCTDSTYTILATRNVSVTFKIWGAGAGGAYAAGSALMTHGGGGGYAAATIDLAANATYTAVIGQGGINGDVTKLTRCGGGGGVGNGAANAGAGTGASGGGFGGLFAGTVDPANALLIAGGGGGGTGDPESGGAGGGAMGAQSIDGVNGRFGGGGTQTMGGDSGNQNGYVGDAGSALTGGSSNWSSDGGGGGGFFGGGSGGSAAGGAGGGGSGFCATIVRACSYGDAPVAGSAGAPGNAVDPDRGAAGSGAMGLTAPGGSARIVLRLSS